MFWTMFFLFVGGILIHTLLRASEWKKAVPGRSTFGYFRDMDRFLTKSAVWQFVIFALWYTDQKVGGFGVRSIMEFGEVNAFLLGYFGDSIVKHVVTRLPIPIIGHGKA